MGRSAAKASSVGAIKALVSVHATPEAAPAAAAAAPAATEPVAAAALRPKQETHFTTAARQPTRIAP